MMTLWWVAWHWLAVLLLLCSGWTIYRWDDDRDPALDNQEMEFLAHWRQARR